MAGFMEILQIKRIVPNLIHGRAVERCFPNLELNDKYYLANQQDYIHSAAHTRNIELQVECPILAI